MKKQSEFRQYIKSLHKSKIFFDPLRGNHGDYLIRVGAEYLFEQLNCVLTKDLKEAEYIILNGGGYFNTLWGGGNKTLCYYRKKNPKVPLIMGPQTYKFTDKIESEFREICRISSAPIILFAREIVSYQKLCEMNLPNNVEIKISQDLAFELEGSPFIEQLKQNSTNEYVLISMRLDRESSSWWIRQLFEWQQILNKTGQFNLVRRILGKTQRLSRPLILSSVCNDIFAQYKLKNLPYIHKDVSCEAFNFEDFCNKIQKAAFIITERLHVGILGYLLNKPVVLVANPNYHKVRAVYEYSMQLEDSNTSLYDIELTH